MEGVAAGVGRVVPAVGWLHRYQRSWLTHDLIGGLAAGSVVIPQAMAYASIADLPGGVIGFEGAGKLEKRDYTDVLLPAIEAAGKEVRVVLIFPDWDGMTSGAFWEDLKMGVEHLTRWKRIALVTDVEWMIHLTHLFGWMTPGDMKHFPLDQRAEAIAWAAAD